MQKENESIIKQLSITPESLENKKIIKQPEIIYSLDLKELSQKAFDILKLKIEALLQNNNPVNIAVCGGRSPIGIYSLLQKADLPWEKIHWFFTDERIYDSKSKETNKEVIETGFIQKLLEKEILPKDNYHPYIPDDIKDKGIQQYAAELQKYGGKCHIIILGAGEDGHIASLFPNHPSILNDTDSDYFLVHNAPKDPPERMSMSKKLLLKADLMMVMFVNESKQQAYDLFKQKKNFANIISCPARIAYQIEDSKVITNLR